MPRRPPPPPPKGTRYGKGRAKGTPNRISVELKTLIGQLVNDAAYQHRLRADFRQRKVHPTIEALIWNHSIGKPKETVELTADISVTGRIEEERAAFATLELHEMEELAAESQRLVDRAMALSRLRLQAGSPQDVVVEAIPPETGAESLGKVHGSDNEYSVGYEPNPSDTPASDSSAEGKHDADVRISPTGNAT